MDKKELWKQYAQDIKNSNALWRIYLQKVKKYADSIQEDGSSGITPPPPPENPPPPPNP